MTMRYMQGISLNCFFYFVSKSSYQFDFILKISQVYQEYLDVTG